MFRTILWDLDDDPQGNVVHCAEHGISKEEIEEVFENPEDIDLSRSSGYPIVFGTTQAERHLMVVYELIDKDTVYPITAYDVPRKYKP